jgi:hypothetical protein
LMRLLTALLRAAFLSPMRILFFADFILAIDLTSCC